MKKHIKIFSVSAFLCMILTVSTLAGDTPITGFTGGDTPITGLSCGDTPITGVTCGDTPITGITGSSSDSFYELVRQLFSL